MAARTTGRIAGLTGTGQVGESVRSYDSVIVNRSHELGADHPDALDDRHSKGKMLVVNGDGPLAVARRRSRPGHNV
jgi:hypothetical protein